MNATAEQNFAGRLVTRLGPASRLIDAATGHSIGAEELPRQIMAYAACLLSAGLERGDRVLIACTLSPSSALAYLGAIYAGLVAVPVDERTLMASESALLHITGAKAIWSDDGVSARGAEKQSAHRLRVDFAGESVNAIAPAACAENDLAALMATSGSTGVPRFVKVSHGNLTANTEAIIRSQRLGRDEIAMVALPLSYCFGASLLHTHLYQGGGVVFDRRFMFPDKVFQAMAEFHCTTFAGVPTVYNTLLRRSAIRQFALPGLRRFLQAGGGLAPEKINAMRDLFPSTAFYVMYGQTEATARISCMEPERWADRRGSVGRPLENLTVAIVDEQGDEVPAGTPGELLVRGPSVCSGYWNDAEETRRVFSGGWLHTGDIARQDEEGYLWIEGRRGAFLKVRGTRVSLAEVEGRVAAIHGINECGACAVEHPDAGEALQLFVVPDLGARINIDEIRRTLPAHWTLDAIRIVPELPKTYSGKIARSVLSGWAKGHDAALV